VVDKKNGESRRREVLKQVALTGGTAVAATGTIGSVSGRRPGASEECDSLRSWLEDRKAWENQTPSERRRTIRVIDSCKRSEGPEAVSQIREEFGISHGGTTKKFDISMGEKPNEYETQDIRNPDQGGVEINFTGTKIDNEVYNITMSVYYAGLEAYCRRNSMGTPQQAWKSGGEKPIDGGAIAWYNDARSEQYFERARRGRAGFDTNGNNCEFDEWKRDKAATYRFDDKAVSKDWLNKSWYNPCKDKEGSAFAGSAYAEIRPRGDWDPSEREVYGQYTHTYNKSVIAPSFSVGFPPSVGVTVQPKDKTKQERIYDNERGYELKLKQSNME
jgi:hypothetical protein